MLLVAGLHNDLLVRPILAGEFLLAVTGRQSLSGSSSWAVALCHWPLYLKCLFRDVGTLQPAVAWTGAGPSFKQQRSCYAAVWGPLQLV
jgi:hypothetical protein